ncbi:PaaI family thioesterase [Palleronia sp. LCG004]|uniref:PaaI family thioesterase n=1 Tax=Palleronia sp. LCG004 TaxID=3079304 RepID=UPI0029435F24|nr:PaaI family thioesterase [Palleronia sp. LCG004]WOI57031.1 PaaI family thioesterase [Palleronia sp. LCG004]
MGILMDKDALDAFLRREFPQIGDDFSIEDVTLEGARVRLNVSDKHLRPGGTVSGPSMFALADVSVYLAILARLGPVGLAVTTSCAIDFLRKPASGRDLVASTRLLKVGRVLVVGDVLIHSEGMEEPVARASLTYSIPPEKPDS